MKKFTLLFCLIFPTTLFAQNVVVEAENYKKQSKIEIRKWYVTNAGDKHNFQDLDSNSAETASAGAYLEILPDTRVTHDDVLTSGVNFSNTPGEMCIVHYDVNIPSVGRYYVWVKAHSTGSEDNGVHVGFDGNWPASGARMQWCQGKNKWTWGSKQRTAEVHCGEPYLIYLDIEKAGRHEIHFSLREDGFEMDKFLLTMDRDFVPDTE